MWICIYVCICVDCSYLMIVELWPFICLGRIITMSHCYIKAKPIQFLPFDVTNSDKNSPAGNQDRPAWNRDRTAWNRDFVLFQTGRSWFPADRKIIKEAESMALKPTTVRDLKSRLIRCLGRRFWKRNPFKFFRQLKGLADYWEQVSPLPPLCTHMTYSIEYFLDIKFSLEEIEGRGRGLIASTNIKPGEEIIVDQPILLGQFMR